MCVQVESINLAGLDRVMVAYAAGSSERSLLLRQYRISYKKSGTRVGGVVAERMLGCAGRRPRWCHTVGVRRKLRALE